VGNAVLEVKKAAYYATKAIGGHVAIREAVELILNSRGIWEMIIDKTGVNWVYIGNRCAIDSFDSNRCQTGTSGADLIIVGS
jgi:hypothetical protein